MQEEYNCFKCGDEWGWFPEDYDEPDLFDRVCPFCNMPKSQLFSEVYKEEGFFAAVKEVARRI